MDNSDRWPDTAPPDWVCDVAMLVNDNRMPHMSGDPRKRLPRSKQREFNEVVNMLDDLMKKTEAERVRLEKMVCDGTKTIRKFSDALAAADKGSPIYKAVELILDEHSAWIARPSPDVTKAIALAAGVAWMAADKISPELNEMDRALSEARAALAVAQAEAEKLRGLVRDAIDVAENGLMGLREDLCDTTEGVNRAVVFCDGSDDFIQRARAALAQGGRDE